jgi:hypothetical protein
MATLQLPLAKVRVRSPFAPRRIEAEVDNVSFFLAAKR